MDYSPRLHDATALSLGEIRTARDSRGLRDPRGPVWGDLPGVDFWDISNEWMRRWLCSRYVLEAV